MRYVEPVFRPPSEAYSYILQVTYGCAHNKCTFCGMYSNKPFKVRPFAEVEEDIKDAARQLQGIKRVFLADGDAMVLKTKSLLRILDCLHEHLPQLARVGIYTDAHGINRKAKEELAELKKRKLSLVYMGLESGSEKILQKVVKSCTAAEMTAAVEKARNVGIKTSVIGLLGLGGKEQSDEHARETAKVVSAMSPAYFSALTVTLVPGTEFAEQVGRGDVSMLSPQESLEEMYRMVEGIKPARPVIFRTNHASNYLAIGGTLPKDRDTILSAISETLKSGNLRPEWMRGL